MKVWQSRQIAGSYTFKLKSVFIYNNSEETQDLGTHVLESVQVTPTTGNRVEG